MGEKVRKGVKNEDGSYTYYYDKSPYPGSQSKQNLINSNKETKSTMKKKMSGIQKIVTRSSGSKKAEKKKMPKARDMAMGDKNISYVGDPFIVDGKVFDPAKKFPETYMRPEGEDNYSTGGEINVGKGGDYIKDLID